MRHVWRYKIAIHNDTDIISIFRTSVFDLTQYISNICRYSYKLQNINIKIANMSFFQKIKLEEKNMNEDWDRLMNSHLQAVHSYEGELNKKKS